MIYYHVPITHLENIPNSSVGKCCPCFHVSFFPLLICISVYGKERNNYDQHNIHLWGNMDSVAYLGSLNINHRITPCRCCWIDDCNWWTPIDGFIHDQACVWPAVLKYLPLLNSFTQPMLCLTQISPWENDSLFFFFFFQRDLRVMCLLPSQLEAMKVSKVGNQNAEELPLVFGFSEVITFV